MYRTFKILSSTSLEHTDRAGRKLVVMTLTTDLGEIVLQFYNGGKGKGCLFPPPKANQKPA